MSNFNTDIIDAIVFIWVTILFAMFWGEPDLSDRIFAIFEKQCPIESPSHD